MRRRFSDDQKHFSVTHRSLVSDIVSLGEKQFFIKMQKVLFCTPDLLHQKFQLYVGRNPRGHRNILHNPYELGVFVYK